MPVYEYVCTTCGQHTEARQSFSDPPLEICPNCGCTLKRVFHPVGIVLKGSGFYSTDNRGSRKGAGKERDKEPAKGETMGETKGETKTDTKKTSKPEGSGSPDKSAS